MMSLDEIKSILEENKAYLFSAYPIESLAIFGSYATQNQHEVSDLDLLVEFNNEIGVGFIDLANELEKLIGFKVDLVSKNGIKEKYFQTINADLIYA